MEQGKGIDFANKIFYVVFICQFCGMRDAGRVAMYAVRCCAMLCYACYPVLC